MSRHGQRPSRAPRGRAGGSSSARNRTRWLVALTLGLLLFGAASAATATESLLVRVQRPLDDDPLIDEAVNRVIGELGALGFDVEVLRRRTRPADLDVPGQLDAGTEGALVFARDGDTVVVSAWVAGGSHAFVQRFSVREPKTTAEVIAVSSVEALRGALIEPSREPSPSGPTAADGPALPAPEATVAKPPAQEPAPRDPLVLPPSNVQLQAMTFLAATAGLDGGLLPNLGATGNLLVGIDHFAIGAGVQRLFYAAGVDDDAGRAHIERQHVAFILHGQVDLVPRWEAFAELQAGVVSYSVHADAAAGFLATERTYSDLWVGGGVGITQWIFPHIGWFGRAEALVLPKPIRIVMDDRAVATLGSPAATLAVGIAARVQ